MVASGGVMSQRRVFTGLLLAFFLALSSLPVMGQGDSTRVQAPPFPADVAWLNVPAPLDWAVLRGKVVVLDFWTYGCINCIHILPDLKRLEREFASELVVIGVHSAKFDNERVTENIRQILQRYEITHPVINDRDFNVWRRWGIRAWPTVMVIDPEGYVVGYHEGEGVYAVLQPVIADLVTTYDVAGKIVRAPIALAPDPRPEMLLAFPGKVLADAVGGRLFIADTNHNRIVVAALDSYEVLTVIGGIEAGYRDGSFAVARFNKPQGMALSADGNTLYVTDSGNHTLRAIDLVAETVRTLAGNGQQAVRLEGGIGPQVALSSPWDVARAGDTLYIAMAGAHQLWRYDIASGEVWTHAGSGAEGLVDGPHALAQLAQPSGITTDQTLLYFADSEASAIRIADVDSGGGVHTIVGTGLFDFGDRDGVGRAALLQHPLGIVYAEGMLYVADTYNNKIKQIDPVSGEVRTLAGQTGGGYQDGSFAEALFDEPGGLSYAAGRLYVADTNNHMIRVLDLVSGMVSSVRFANPDALQADRSPAVAGSTSGDNEITLEPQIVAPGDATLTLHIELPEGYKINDLATSTLTWQPDGAVVRLDPALTAQEITEDRQTASVPAMLAEGDGSLAAEVRAFYCEAVNEALCFVEQVRIVLPVRVRAGAAGHDLAITYSIAPPAAGWPQ